MRKGVKMRVTPQLVLWLQAEMQRRKLTYRRLGKDGKTNWQNFQRLIQAGIAEISADMEDSVCMAFGITRDQMRLIAEGKTPAQCPQYDLECEKSRAVWRWIAYDEKRIAVIRAMGYVGDLPDPVHGKDVK